MVLPFIYKNNVLTESVSSFSHLEKSSFVYRNCSGSALKCYFLLGTQTPESVLDISREWDPEANESENRDLI